MVKQKINLVETTQEARYINILLYLVNIIVIKFE